MATWPPLHVIGVSHRKADLGLRERFTRSRAGILALLSGAEGPRRGIVLSTCNRFEIYWWGTGDWAEWFHTTAADQGAPLPPSAMVRKEGGNAARHLFRVAAGMDSQVVGEVEILGQVRRAWETARHAGATCRELDLVFATSLTTGRRVRRETSLGRPPASIGSVSVDYARAALGGTLRGRRVLVIGTGQAARAVLAALAGLGARVQVLSRARERSERLAAVFDAESAGWDTLHAMLAESEVVFTATAAPACILTTDQLATARHGVTVIDLGVPRNVEPAARGVPHVRIIDLDDLRADGGTEREPSHAVLESAGDLVDEEVARLLERLRGLTAGDRLADLHRLGARLAQEETALALRELGSLNDAEREVVRRMAERLVRRVLYPASRTLRGSGSPPPLNGATAAVTTDTEA